MTQFDFFQHQDAQFFDIENGKLVLFPQVFSPVDTDKLFLKLRSEIQWRQDQIHIAGQLVLIPRLQAWYGDANANYQYSGLSMAPLPWSGSLLEIKLLVETLAGARFNSVLLNLYRDGADSVGWHSDDEAELGDEPVIASLSLGAIRDFSLRQKKPGSQQFKMALPSGSLLVMSGCLQQYWQHQVPKTQKPVGERINLTFRLVQH